MSMIGSGRVFRPEQHVQPVRQDRPRDVHRRGAEAAQFGHMLQRRMAADKVRISAHASDRLRNAGVEVDARFEKRLQTAVNKAAAKGSRSSLVLLDQLALVVSVQNRTVITAVDSERMKENVFTNIDSAVIS